MKANIKICLIIVLLFPSMSGFSQQNYYWSGDRKNFLTVDSTRMVVYAKDGSNLELLKSKVASQKKITSITGLSIGNKSALEIKIDKARYKTLKDDISKLPELEFTMPYYSLENKPIYFTGEIVLHPRNGISINQIIGLVGGKISLKARSRNGIYLLEVNDEDDILKIANDIYESGLVEWCHPNFNANLTRSVVPTDPMFAQQYYLHNTGQLGGVSNFDINAPEAWDITRGCNNVRVVVIDDGVEAHEDMAGRVLAGFTPRGGGNGTPIAGGGHGQSCAGIIAASHNNGLGISGVAPNSLIIPVNMFVPGTTAVDVAAGINWAWDPARGNADIISNSWGGTTADVIRFEITQARTQGRVRNGVALGCIVVFASGNTDGATNGAPVSFPGNVDGVITVGAIRNNGTIWNYSHRGPEMDLVAPSGDMALRGDVRTTDRMGGNGFDPGNYTNRFGGTSASCPQVAGIAALMLSINPNLTEIAVRTTLQQTARDLGPIGFDNTYGFGLVNAEAALNRVIANQGTVLSGPGFVCTSANYSINFPAGSLITWQTSPNLTVPRTVSSTVSASKSGGNGPGFIQASRSQNGCSYSVRKVVHVGPESANFSIYGYPNCASPGEVPTFVAQISGVNYNWIVNGGTLLGGQGTQSIYARMDNQTMAVHCNVSGNSAANCYGPQGISSIYINPCWGFSSVSTFPNPATTSLEVELSEKIDNTEPVEIEIRNGYGELVKSVAAQGAKFRVNLPNLKNGAYILKVKYRDQLLTHRVLVEN